MQGFFKALEKTGPAEGGAGNPSEGEKEAPAKKDDKKDDDEGMQLD